MNVLLTAWDTKPEAHQGDVPTSLTDTQNVFLCRDEVCQEVQGAEAGRRIGSIEIRAAL
jgi:hypothetical protein